MAEPGFVLALKLRDNALGQHFAQFHTPLITGMSPCFRLLSCSSIKPSLRGENITTSVQRAAASFRAALLEVMTPMSSSQDVTNDFAPSS